MSNFKVGDYVLRTNRMKDQIGKVEEITKAGNVRAFGVLFDKYGCERGSAKFKTDYIQVLSEDEYNRYKNKFMANKLKKEIIQHLQKNRLLARNDYQNQRYNKRGYNMTNREWMETLNDEDLAEFLEGLNVFCDACEGDCEKCVVNTDKLKWLQDEYISSEAVMGTVQHESGYTAKYIIPDGFEPPFFGEVIFEKDAKLYIQHMNEEKIQVIRVPDNFIEDYRYYKCDTILHSERYFPNISLERIYSVYISDNKVFIGNNDDRKIFLNLEIENIVEPLPFFRTRCLEIIGMIPEAIEAYNDMLASGNLSVSAVCFIQNRINILKS